MASNSISQRIALEGAEAVAAAFEKIGKAGEDAFKKIDAAAKKGSGADFVEAQFRPAVEAAEKFGESLGKVIGDVGHIATRLVEASAAVAAFSAGFVTFVNLASRSGDAMLKLSEQTGQTVETVSALTSTFSSFGISANQTAAAFDQLAVKVEKAWAQIQKSVRDRAVRVIQDQLAIQNAASRLAQTEITLDFIVKTNQQQKIADAVSVRGALLNLYEAQNRLADLEGRPRPHDKEELDRKKAILAVQEARLRLEEARTKAARDAAEAEQKEKDAALARENALLQVAAARKKAAEDAANDIGRLAKFVDDLASGVIRSGEGLNKSVDNMVKGILAAAGAGAQGIDNIGKSVGAFATAAPNQLATILKLADLFKNLGDEQLKLAIATQLFGKAIAGDMVRALNQGSAAILEERNRLQSLGLTFSEAEARAANAFRRAFASISDTLGLISDKVGITFAPLLTDIFNKVRAVMERNLGSIKEFAERIRDTVAPIITGLANSILGLRAPQGVGPGQRDAGKSGGEKEDELIRKTREWQDTFDRFTESISTFFFQTLPNGFAYLMGILDDVAASINRIAGTNLSGTDLGIGLLVGQFLGLNRAIVDVIGLVINLGTFLGVLALLNPFGAAIAAAFLFGAALAALATAFPEQALSLAIGVVTGLLLVLAATNPFAALVIAAGALGVALEALVANWDAVTDAISRAVDKIREFFGIRQATGTEGGAGTGTEFAPGGFASGGYVRGPGTATSDSILARLSRGEFVINARAVDHFGPAFFAALNRMRMPGFSVGGLVNGINDALAIPRFATGRLVASGGGGLHPVTIDLGGGRMIGGLMAPANVVTNLKRAAVESQVSSTGKSPSWKR